MIIRERVVSQGRFGDGAISPDFLPLRSHKRCNNIKRGSNNFPLETPFYFDSRKLTDPLKLPVQSNRRIKRQVSIAADNLLRYHK